MSDVDDIKREDEAIDMVEKNEMQYTISEAADRYHVTQKTLRHYEEVFNLEISRNERGRYYTERDFEILDIIVELKKKGLSLKAIKETLQERGFLKFDMEHRVIRVDENTEDMKSYLMTEIGSKISQVLQGHLSEHHQELLEVIEQHQRVQRDLIEHQNTEIAVLRQQLEQAADIIQKQTVVMERLEEQSNKSFLKKIFG